MKNIESNEPSKKHIITLYFCYITVALLILTDLLGLWTAMASLFAIFSFIIAPIITGIIAFKNYKKVNITKKHKNLFYFSILYSAGIIITIIMFQNI